MSLYENHIVYLRNSLESLKTILAKANENGKLPELLATRLVPDMLPLTFQIFMVIDLSCKAVARGLNKEIDSIQYSESLTLDELNAGIAKAISQLESVDQKTLDARTNEKFTFAVADYTGEATVQHYLETFTQPNVAFHLVTAYNILRLNGIPLGKFDYSQPYGMYVGEHNFLEKVKMVKKSE